MKKSPNSFLSLKIYQNGLYTKKKKKYLLRNTIRLQQHGPKLLWTMPAQNHDLLPCSALHFLGGAKKVAFCNSGVHGPLSTLMKEQREKAILIKILGVITQSFALQLSVTPFKNSLQCVTRNILLCLNEYNYQKMGFFLPNLNGKEREIYCVKFSAVKCWRLAVIIETQVFGGSPFCVVSQVRHRAWREWQSSEHGKSKWWSKFWLSLKPVVATSSFLNWSWG